LLPDSDVVNHFSVEIHQMWMFGICSLSFPLWCS